MVMGSTPCSCMRLDHLGLPGGHLLGHLAVGGHHLVHGLFLLLHHGLMLLLHGLLLVFGHAVGPLGAPHQALADTEAAASAAAEARVAIFFILNTP